MQWLFVLLIVPARAHLFDTPQNISSSPCTDRNHLFLAPGVLTAGGTSRTCVSRFYTDGPAQMSLTLTTEDGETVTASRDLLPGDGGCLDISVPLQPNTKAELNVNIRYPEAKCTWERRISLRIASGRVVVVHTERARYRPGDAVKIRAVALKADLSPTHSNIEEIWLEGPSGAWEGTRVAQWRRVRTRLGLAQLQHVLDDLAPPGRWTVRARLADGSQGSTSFWVGNYQLPPFQLTVRHAPRVLRSSEKLIWTVCVRYPWSEAVEGMLVIRLRGAGASGIRTAVRIKAPRACHRHAAAPRRVGLTGDKAPDVVIADFSFQEEGTRVWQNTTVVSQVVDEPVSLQFLTRHRTLVAPGLPYKLKVKATRWDDKAAVGEHVRVCRSPATLTTGTTDKPTDTKTDTCVDSITDSKGIARVLFSADDGAPYYNFEARLNNATAQLQAWSVNSKGRAALGPLKDTHRSLVPLYLSVPTTTPVTVHFVVITRGGIIYRWGATTQCPTTTDNIQTAPRNSVCPQTNLNYIHQPPNLTDLQNNLTQSNANNSSQLDSLLDKHLSKVMLPIKVTHQMCPESHLIAYFYYKNELISASKHFEMEDCFANKVEATWLSRQTAPGSIASLQVTTPGPSLCALSVLDTASKWAQPGESVRALLMKGLRRMMGGRGNLTEHDAAGECFLTSDSPDLPNSSIDLLSSWLSSAGVRLLGGSSTKRGCSPPPSPLLADEGFTPRSDFSESWLWRLAAVGSNGSVVASARAPDSITRFEASALCIGKNGLGLSQPAVLQVFREFFIHADGPKRLRRGDSAIISYRIFNYLYEPLSVNIEILSSPHLVTSSTPSPVCLLPRSSAARRLDVTARIPGTAALRVRASCTAPCGNTTSTAAESSQIRQTDEVIIHMEVDPEGVPVQEHKSAMLCAIGSSSLSSSPEALWSWSAAEIVPGTESVSLWATADPIGPLLADADALVLLPRGCGEQNMARLATNLLALTLLDHKSTAAVIAKDHVARGFTRQLQYAHSSGGFSAFGPVDPSPSTWLTAFCVRYLRRAYQILSPEAATPPAISQSERWLRQRQLENGCFRSDGTLFHSELKGGLDEDGEVASVALTAYVITSLIESTSPLSTKLLKNSLSCLRALPPLKTKTPSSSRVYAHSLITYAFMRLRRYDVELRKTNEASLLWDKRDVVGAGLEEDEELKGLLELLRIAKRSGSYVWWETDNLATSIESTGYALLALSECPAALKENCAQDASGAVLWLSAHRGATGGFLSTQDTLVALEGMSRWSSLFPRHNVSVSVNGIQKLQLYPGARVPERTQMPVGDQMRVHVEGSGCALVQATRSYNTLSPPEGSDLSLRVQVSVQTEGAFHCDANANMKNANANANINNANANMNANTINMDMTSSANASCFCAAVVQACVRWRGSFPSMALLAVSLAGGYAADAALLYRQLQNTDTLLRRIELSSNSDKATFYLGTRDGSDTVPRMGHQCYSLHAVGPRAKTKPAYAKVIDYYRPHIMDTQMYTIPEDCPSRIAHEEDKYHTSDNLFNKARSLTDSGEIVITHEYTFEDIPEGVPLEDPLYDNLTKMDKNEYSDADEQTDEANKNKNETANKTVVKNAILSKEITYTDLNVNENRYREVTDENAIPIDITNHVVKDDNSKYIAINNSIHINNVIIESDNEIPKDMVQKDHRIEIRDETSKEVTKAQINKANLQEHNQDLVANDDMKDMHNAEEKLAVNNPLLSTFHVVDSDKDLEVPTGIEGPVPAIVLPPQNFVAPPNIGHLLQPHTNWRRVSNYRPQYYRPMYYKPNYNNYQLFTFGL